MLEVSSYFFNNNNNSANFSGEKKNTGVSIFWEYANKALS